METDTATLQQLLKAKEDALQELKASFEEFKEEANEYERELEADNEHKEKEIESLHKKLEAATKKMDEYKKEISLSNRIMEREKGKLDTLNEELASMKIRIVHLEQSNEELEGEIRNVKFEKQELMEKVEGLEERFVIEREDLEEQLRQKNEELERFRLDVHEYEDELVLWKRKSLQKSVSRAGSMVDVGEPTDAEKIAQLQEEMGKYREELERLKDELGDRNRDIVSYTSRIDDMEEEMELLRERLDQKEKEFEAKEDELAEVKNENLGLKEKLREKEDCITELNVKIEAEHVKNKEYQEQITELSLQQHTKRNSAVVEETGCIAIEEDRESQKTGEDSRIKEDPERLLIELQEKEELINQLNSETAELKSCLEEEKNHNNQLENFVAGLSTELEEEREISSELRKEIEEHKNRQVHIAFRSEMSENNEENRSPQSGSFVENTSPSTYAREEEECVEDQEEQEEQNDPEGEDEDTVEREESVEDMMVRIQEENAKLAETYQALNSIVGVLKDKVAAIQADKAKLEADVNERDRKIFMLEKLYSDLQKELRGTKENQDPIQQKEIVSNKIPKLDISDAFRSDMDTMPTDHYQSAYRNGVLAGDRSNNNTDAKKMFSKYLYVKQSKTELPSYIKLQDKCVSLDVRNEGERVSKDYAMDRIFSDVYDIDVQETLGCPLNEALGKNLLFVIYGDKKTDKRQIRYKIMQDFIKLFRAMSIKEKFQGKVCKVAIKLQAPTVLGSASSKHPFDLNKLNEFTIGNTESEHDLYEYFKFMKEVDSDKNNTIYLKNQTPSNLKIGLKQIVLELSVRDKNTSKTQNNRPALTTKVILSTLNNYAEEDCSSLFNIILAQGVINQKDQIEKHIFLAIDPSESAGDCASVANTLAFGEKMENFSVVDRDFSTPVHQLETDSTGFSPEKGTSEEKFYVPGKLKKMRTHGNNESIAYPQRKLSINSSATNAYGRSESLKTKEGKPRHKSSKSNFFQDKVGRLFGFVKTLKSEKKERSQSRGSFDDPKMSMLSMRSAAPSSNVVRKLVVQLD